MTITTKYFVIHSGRSDIAERLSYPSDDLNKLPWTVVLHRNQKGYEIPAYTDQMLEHKRKGWISITPDPDVAIDTQAEVDALVDQISQNTIDVGILGTQVAANDLAVQALSDDVDSLTTTVGGFASDISTVQSGLSDLQTASDAAISFLDLSAASGNVTGGAVSLTGGATFSISAGTGFLKDITGSLTEFAWSTKTGTCPYAGSNYISIDYTGAVVYNTEPSYVDTQIPVGFIFISAGQPVAISNIKPNTIPGYQARVGEFLQKGLGPIIEYGASLSEQPAPDYGKVSVSPGRLWPRLTAVTTGAITTFTKLYQFTGSGVAIDAASAANTVVFGVYNVLTNAQGSALQAMTATYWKKDLFFMSGAGALYYAYGQAEYATEDAARNAPTPAIPDSVKIGAFYIASVVTQAESTSIASGIVDIRPIVTRLFERGSNAILGSAVDHSSLFGLNNDDHTQYHTDTRGDVRYYRKAELTSGALDSRYYTESEADTLLLAKLAATHEGSGGATHAVATTLASGFLSASDKLKLNGIATGATANQTDSHLLDRANHTGTQSASTITGLTSTSVGLGNLVNVDNTNASNLSSGTIAIERLPAAVIERLVIVANQAARYALTTATVQNGDVVKETDTGYAYFVVDDTKLNLAAGYETFTVGSAASVPWAGITSVPTNLLEIAALTKTNDYIMQVKGGVIVFSTPATVKSDLVLTSADVGLGNVNNTSDANKPVSTAQQTALNGKQNSLTTGTIAQYFKGDLSLGTFASDALAVLLAGLSTATNAIITASDSVLVAFGKLQAQVTANLSTLTGHTGNTSNPHSVTAAQVGAVVANGAITGATKTKITYDSKGLVTSGADATTADIADSTNKRYVTDANLTTIGNQSGTNTGDNAINTLYSGLVSNATHTGEVTGATALTITPGAVTLAKMADMATSSIIYRKTAGSGVPEVQTLATLKTDLGLTGTNSGDQTAIPNATLATMPTKTYKGNTTAGTATPTDVPVATLKTDLALVKADVGLGNVDNTSDANKPVSTAQQTALDLKANLASPTFTGTVTLPAGTVTLAQQADMATGSLVYRKTAGAGAPEVNTLATLKTDLALTKADVGLANVANVDQQNASNLTSGTVGTARLGTGTANASTFLRGDGTWATPAGGSGSSNAAIVSCDFGASFNDKAQTVVTGQTWVTATSSITPQVRTPAGVDPDEMYLLGIRAEISSIVPGVGFTVTLYSQPQARGTYDVMISGV